MYIECDGVVDTADMLTLEMIVAFATGLPEPPPLGFSPKPGLLFHDDHELPYANTCTNQLYLPLKITYEKFKYRMSYAILNTQGFGQV